MMSFSEEWKSIPGYEGFYEISNQGNLRSLDRSFIDRAGRTQNIKGIVKKQTTDKDGYKIVRLSMMGETGLNKVHRLVLTAFSPIDNPDEKVVNHIDGNKCNNRIENIEWCSLEHNAQHFRNELYHGKFNRGSKLKDFEVTGVYEMFLSKFKYKSICERYSICEHTVREIVTGKFHPYLFGSYKKNDLLKKEYDRRKSYYKIEHMMENFPEVEKMWDNCIPREVVAKKIGIGINSVKKIFQEIAKNKTSEEIKLRRSRYISIGKKNARK